MLWGESDLWHCGTAGALWVRVRIGERLYRAPCCAGLRQYIKASTLPDTCVIAYDTRNNGLLFSQTCAAALAECGIQVYLFSKPTPTPVLSFAVRHLHTGGGVVMTASHNPAPYNGMKCYGSDGCQQTDDPAAEVYARMRGFP